MDWWLIPALFAGAFVGAYLGWFIVTNWRAIGDAAEASHRGQRGTWAAEPDQLPEPDKPRHRKDQS